MQNLNLSLSSYKIKVLLVDDQPIVESAVKMMLAADSDLEFYYCKDPAEALTVAATLKPTVILQDLVMPDIDGLTLVKFYRGHPALSDTPIIVLSSKEEAITKSDAFEAGANDYLVKLPDKIELIARIKYHSKAYINLMQRNEAYNALAESQQALATQLQKAADYVESLLPPPVKTGAIRTDWRFFPSNDLGGDSFGYHDIDEENYAMYLLDVCDHGVGPALLSVSALNVLRSQSLPNTDFREPSAVLKGLNEAFEMEKQNNLYFTIWYGVFNRTSRVLKYGSAGHPPALLVKPTGESLQLITKNLIIGHLPQFNYKSAMAEVPPNSELYIYSDGCYEIQKAPDEMWTLEEMDEYLKQNRTEDSQEINKLYKMLQVMNKDNNLPDDFSMLKIYFD